MSVVEFVEPGMRRNIYDVVSLSQRLISTINTSANLHDHAEVDKIDVPTMKTFASKERHPVMSAELIAENGMLV